MYLNREDIIRLAEKAGFECDSFGIGIWDNKKFNIFANLVAAEERETCAKLCEDLAKWHSKTVIAALDSAAENIRDRSLDVHN